MSAASVRPGNVKWFDPAMKGGRGNLGLSVLVPVEQSWAREGTCTSEAPPLHPTGLVDLPANEPKETKIRFGGFA